MDESFSGFKLGRDPVSHGIIGLSEFDFVPLDPIAKMASWFIQYRDALCVLISSNISYIARRGKRGGEGEENSENG